MRVLHVIPSVSLKRGGPSVAVRLMAESTARLAAQVEIATTDDDGAGRIPTRASNAPVVENDVTLRYFPRQSHFYTFSLPLVRWLSAHVRDYDLVHIHALFSFPVTSAAMAAHTAGVPYILRPLGTLNQWGVQQRRPVVKRASLRVIEKPILQRAAAIHFTSRAEEQEAAQVGITHPNSVVLPIGIDLAPFCQLPDATKFRQQFELGDAPLLLSMGRLDPKKGLEVLLEGFAAIARGDASLRLVMAGKGAPAYEARLRALAESLGISRQVCWTGFVSGERKLAALAAADLFVMPSYSENFGIAAVEALAAGIPVVASTGVAIHQEISDAGAGVAIPPAAAPLADALRALLAEAPRRAAMASAARELAASHFSQSVMAERLMSLYHSVLDKEKSVSKTLVKPTHTQKLPVSVVILTYNEEENLPDCLSSVRDWAGELFVVDSGSTDNTVAIAEAAGAAVVPHPFENYAKQRNWAQANLPLRHDWVLHLDADERVTPDLQRSISDFFHTEQHHALNGAYFSRRTIFMGRWIRYGGHYPVYHTRLFRREAGSCENLPYDQHFLVSAPTVRLRGDLIDVLTTDLDTWSQRHIRWAGKESAHALSRERAAEAQLAADLGGTPIERRRWLKTRLFGRVPLLWRAFGYFLYRYIFRLGFLDGREGLIFHFLQGCWFRFYIDAKIHEQQLSGKGK